MCLLVAKGIRERIQNRVRRARDVTLLALCLLSVIKAVDLIPAPHPHKLDVVMYTCNTSTKAESSGVSIIIPGLNYKFQPGAHDETQ